MDAVKEPGCGAKEAMERLVKQWQKPLLRLCYIQLHDQGLAEDAVQETFLKAYRNWASFHRECSEKTWLTRIAVNTCRDMQRGGWFRHTDRKITPEMLPLAAAPVAEDRMDLAMAVMNLPAKLREAITLYYYQDMDTMEISEALGIAQSSVSNRLRKGRELLRKALEGRDRHA